MNDIVMSLYNKGFMPMNDWQISREIDENGRPVYYTSEVGFYKVLSWLSGNGVNIFISDIYGIELIYNGNTYLGYSKKNLKKALLKALRKLDASL